MEYPALIVFIILINGGIPGMGVDFLRAAE
jgi:hypothetical protein